MRQGQGVHEVVQTGVKDGLTSAAGASDRWGATADM
jgi:hypothetical protein